MVKRIVAISLILFSILLACVLIYLEKWSPSRTIQVTRGQSRIYFEVNHHTQVFSPLYLKWDLKNAKVVQMSRRGRYGQRQGARKLIGTDRAQILVEFPDGIRQTYHLPITVLFRTWQGWLILLALSVMPYTAGVLFNTMPGPGTIFKAISISATHTVRRLKDTIRTEDKLHLAVLCGILLFAVVIRLFYLNQPARFDESLTFTAFAAPWISLKEGLSTYRGANNHPFNTLLIHMATLLFNSIELWVIRLPVFVAGVMLVLATYFVTRLVYNKNAALLAAGLTASASQLILYSTNARGYIFVFLCFMVLIGISYALMHRNTPSTWLLFIMVATCGFYSILLMGYPFGIVFVWIVISTLVVSRSPTRRLLASDLCISSVCVCWLTLLLYLPILVNNDMIGILNRDYTSFLSWSDCLNHLLKAAKGFVGLLNAGLPLWISILLCLGFVVGIIFHRNLSKQKISIALAAIIAMCLIVVIQRPYFRYDRLLLFLLPVYFMVSSAGIIHLLERIWGVRKYRQFLIPLFAVILTGTNGYTVIQERTVYYSKATGTLRSAEDITLYLQNILHSEDQIVTPVPYLNRILLYYFRKHGVGVNFLAGRKLDLTKTKRVFVIVYKNRDGPTTVSKVLEKYLRDRYNRSDFDEPVLLKSYEFSNLYAVQRKH